MLFSLKQYCHLYQHEMEIFKEVFHHFSFYLEFHLFHTNEWKIKIKLIG
jgi:hypothetical protein